MSENWAEMTTDQRDELVAKRVMGWTTGICDGEWGEQPISCDGWYCMKCGYEGHWGAGFEHEKIPPRYTTSMNAAWQLIERFGAAEVKKWPNIRRYENAPYTCHIATHGQTFSEWGSTPQEAICLTALKAVGWNESSAEPPTQDVSSGAALPDASVANGEQEAKSERQKG